MPEQHVNRTVSFMKIWLLGGIALCKTTVESKIQSKSYSEGRKAHLLQDQENCMKCWGASYKGKLSHGVDGKGIIYIPSS